MSHEKILIVEDDENIIELVRYNLEREGFRTVSVDSGEDAQNRLSGEKFDLVLLDLMLPGIDGFDVCRWMKMNEVSRAIPIVMLTARGEESEIIAGLELGADDYIVKPFSPKVLCARVRTVLRRHKTEKTIIGGTIATADFTIHPGKREVVAGGRRVELTNLEFRVLQLLMSKPGWVFTRNQIVEGVRGDNYPVNDRSVDVVITGLRRKLGDCGDRIETVRSAGYRFSELPKPSIESGNDHPA